MCIRDSTNPSLWGRCRWQSAEDKAVEHRLFTAQMSLFDQLWQIQCAFLRISTPHCNRFPTKKNVFSLYTTFSKPFIRAPQVRILSFELSVNFESFIKRHRAQSRLVHCETCSTHTLLFFRVSARNFADFLAFNPAPCKLIRMVYEEITTLVAS